MATEDKSVDLTLPMFRALTEPLLMMGAPPQMIVFNGVVLAIFIMSFHFFWIIPLNIVMHYIITRVTKNDPWAFENIAKYIHQKSGYYT